MQPALILVDAQHDFLGAPSLQPSRSELCAALAGVLHACRGAGVPVVHVWTTVDAQRPPMPHWTAERARRFRVGGEGHTTPAELRPLPGEATFHKQVFSAFGDGLLEPHLRARGVDTVILAGLYLRACIRTTAVDAYQRGFVVWIADDAVGDDDPLHGAISRRYLADRFARMTSHAKLCTLLRGPHGFRHDDDVPSAPPLSAMQSGTSTASLYAAGPGIEHLAPHDGRPLFCVPVSRREQVAAAAETAEGGLTAWRQMSLPERTAVLSKVADRISGESDRWARQIVLETGKPLREARREILFAVALVRSTIRSDAGGRDAAGDATWMTRRRPHGVVAIITPWNNPLAIPLGKIAPAILHGNAVVWKPAIPASGIAVALHRLLQEIGLPEGVVNVLLGDHLTAELLLDHPLVRAASLTGSSEAGYAAQAISARRRIPFQGELGGNNAAIVWADADLQTAAREIAAGGFGSAGQRCTANRRVIVERHVYDGFLAELQAAIDDLPWGDPFDESTVVGPLVSRRACRRVADAVAAARDEGAVVIQRRARCEGPDASGCYFPPTLIQNAASTSDIVQRETFGPVVVLQAAADWREAIALCNGVYQGLVASLFSPCTSLWERFLNEAHAGILKRDQSTAGAAADAPFGGWKSSGIGPPEHGSGDAEFYARLQTVYRGRP